MNHPIEKAKRNPEQNASADPRPEREVELIVVIERLHRYHRGLPCGAAALQRSLREQDCLRPLPSVRRIAGILTLYGLTHRRTGWYEGEVLDWLPESARVPNAQRRSLPWVEMDNI